MGFKLDFAPWKDQYPPHNGPHSELNTLHEMQPDGWKNILQARLQASNESKGFTRSTLKKMQKGKGWRELEFPYRFSSKSNDLMKLICKSIRLFEIAQSA